MVIVGTGLLVAGIILLWLLRLADKSEWSDDKLAANGLIVFIVLSAATGLILTGFGNAIFGQQGRARMIAHHFNLQNAETASDKTIELFSEDQSNSSPLIDIDGSIEKKDIGEAAGMSIRTLRNHYNLFNGELATHRYRGSSWFWWPWPEAPDLEFRAIPTTP